MEAVAPLSSTSMPSPAVEPKTSYWQHLVFVTDNYLRYILSKSLVILLTVYSFYTTWEVILFIALEYPELQDRFLHGLITQAELDFIIAGAVMTIIATIVSTFLAIRLNSTQEKISHTIDIIVTTILILFQGNIRTFLLSLEVIRNWSQHLPL